MSAGKKGKKKKNCKTVDLMSFLADGGGTPTIPLKSTSWADDVEDEHEGGYTSRSNKEPVVLPTAPRAARGSRIDEENIPTNPPFVAYVTSLPYEVDEDDLFEFFAEMKVSSVRLPKDPNKQLRGYGYVEFEDRQSLIDALSMTNTTMKTRRIRIEVSNSSNDERRGGRLGRDNRRDTYDDPERTSGDWRSRPRDEPAGSEGGDTYRRPYDNREREREREVTDDKPGAWRNRSEDDRGRSAFKDRGFRDDDRDKEWSRYGDRGGSRDRDGDRDRDRDRGSSFGPRRDYGDWERDGRNKDGKGNLETKPTETRTRPKLQLQPRTKPIEPLNIKEEKSESTTTSTSTSSAPATNIFGAAKPVDTTAREREIEERLAKSYAESRLKEEAENEKRKEGTWGRRNGEDRDDKEKDKSRETWRSDVDKKWPDKSTTSSHSQHSSTTARSDQHGDSRADSKGDSKGSSKGDSKGDSKNSNSRSGPAPTKKTDNRGLDNRERKDRDKEKDELDRMPKAKDEKAPNFVVSNKYSMLPDDADPDIIED